MADLKISALPSATTPVTGTEVLPIVQSGSTRKVSIDNLTKGKTVNALSFDTDVAAAGVTLSGTTLAADGTNANININLTPKGTGTVVTSINGLAIPGFNTAATISNDNNGFVFSQYGQTPLKIRGIGPSGEKTQLIVGDGNTTTQPQYSFASDTDTGIFHTAGSLNRMSLVAGAVEGAAITATEAVVNDAGGNYDFRVEGDTQPNLLVCDASADRVGVGIATPATTFDVRGTTTATIRVGSSGPTGSSGDEFGNVEFYWSDTDAPEVKAKIYAKNVGSVGPLGGGAADLLIATTPAGGALTERARVTSAGNVVAGGSVALATNATNGFLYVPTCAGTPTGAPTAITGMAPIVVDTTNNKLYFYSGGAWRDAGP